MTAYLESARPVAADPVSVVPLPEDVGGWRFVCAEHPDAPTGRAETRDEAEFLFAGDHRHRFHSDALPRQVVARFAAGANVAVLAAGVAAFTDAAPRGLRVFGCPDGSIEVALR